jgi:adenylate cyclase
MDRIWQWAWDRYGATYSWVIWVVAFATGLPVYLVWSFVVVAFEKSSHYVEAFVVAVVAVLSLAFVLVLPGSRLFRLAERWAAGREVDRARALKDTYTWARAVGVRGLGFMSVWAALIFVVVGVIAGASASRLVQYGIVGAASGFAAALIAVHTFVEGALRPVRAALAGDTVIGDSLPRSRPTFAAWLELSVLGSAFAFSAAAAMLGVVLDRAGQFPSISVVIAAALTVGWGVPITVGAIVSPSLRPIRDLAEATVRVGPATLANGCRWFRTMTSARSRHRSTACRRVWLSGNDFKPRSALTSTRPWRRDCSSRVTTCSRVNAPR